MSPMYAQLYLLITSVALNEAVNGLVQPAFVPSSRGGSTSRSVVGQQQFGLSSSTTTRLPMKDENMTPEEREAAVEKATKTMTAFSNKYITKTGTKYCKDMSVPAVVIKGLAEHKVTLGAPLCPCRYYEDKEREAKDGFWNCPCVPMRERHECHCMLFLTEDSGFVGDRTDVSVEEVVELSSKAMG